MQVEPPPPPLSDDRSASDLARRHLVKSKRLNFGGIPPFTYLKTQRTRGNLNSRPSTPVEQPTPSDDTAEIDLNDTGVDLNNSQDIYKWAVIYENQRGSAFASSVSSKEYSPHLS